MCVKVLWKEKERVKLRIKNLKCRIKSEELNN